MKLTCENCGKNVALSAGKYIYYPDIMMFACKACADKISDEMKCAREICAAVDAKKVQAEDILSNRGSFERFLKNIESIQKKIPNVGNLPSDIPLLVSLVKNYVEGAYTDIPFNAIIIVVATLLYVVSPIDMIPDMIPGVGFTDDAMAVAICKKTIQCDLDKFKDWYDQWSNLIQEA